MSESPLQKQRNAPGNVTEIKFRFSVDAVALEFYFTDAMNDEKIKAMFKNPKNPLTRAAHEAFFKMGWFPYDQGSSMPPISSVSEFSPDGKVWKLYYYLDPGSSRSKH